MARPHHILIVLLLSAPAAASPDVATRTPPSDRAAGPALIALRDQLILHPRGPVAELAKFRPLCDKDGYPLVGNIASKGEGYQPSQFCAEVRKVEKRG